MAKKKTKKIIYKKAVAAKNMRTRKSRVISFFIGVGAVAAIGFLLFNYAQSNNYKTVLGEKTQILKQSSR